MPRERCYYRKLIDIKHDVERRNIIIQPHFQREFCWDAGKKSRFIESVLLDYNLNPLHFSENKHHINEVIDGQQRITTFIAFMDNKFALRGLKKLPDYNNKRFKELPEAAQLAIMHYEIPIFPHSEEEHSARIKYEMFERMNIGSTPLKAMELRNCIYHGNYLTLINQLAATEAFRELIHMHTTRMKDRELVLTFFTLQNYNPEADYRHFKDFLDNELAENVNLPEYEINKKREQFYEFLEKVKLVWNNPFRKPYRNNVFNEDMFRAACVDFTDYNLATLKTYSVPIRHAIGELLEGEEFLDLDAHNMNFTRVHMRAKMLKDAMERAISGDKYFGSLTVDEPANSSVPMWHRPQ